jgi:hypothetical protein
VDPAGANLIDVYDVPVTEFKEKWDDLEGCLRVVALWDSLLAVTKRSVWKRKFGKAVERATHSQDVLGGAE